MIAAVSGKRAVALATVAPAKSPPGKATGDNRPEGGNVSPRNTERLRAIAERAPEPVRHGSLDLVKPASKAGKRVFTSPRPFDNKAIANLLVAYLSKTGDTEGFDAANAVLSQVRALVLPRTDEEGASARDALVRWGADVVDIAREVYLASDNFEIAKPATRVHLWRIFRERVSPFLTVDENAALQGVTPDIAHGILAKCKRSPNTRRGECNATKALVRLIAVTSPEKPASLRRAINRRTQKRP